MRQVMISVEGQTEEAFVNRVLGPHFEPKLLLTPVLVTTRRVPDGPDYKGGYASFAKLKREVLRLLNNTNAVAVTTLYDLYGLPKDLAGMAQPKGLQGIQKAVALEQAFEDAIASPRFRAHLQVHEFEAFLFVDAQATCQVLMGDAAKRSEIERISKSFAGPEHIDDGIKTAPSKRIQGVFPHYDKVLHGPRIAQEVKLDTLRSTCQHFGDWLNWLESL